MSGTTCLSSGLRSVNTLIYTGRGTLNALTVLTNGTDDASVTIYDNIVSGANPEIIAKLICLGVNHSETLVFNLAARCTTGLFAVVSGTGANYIVHFGA